MNPEAQRIAIAEACGMKIPEWFKKSISKMPLWFWYDGPSGSGEFHEVPDYLNDLNAMHEASVDHLDLKQTIIYQDNICAILRRDAAASESEARIMCIDASAAQRAEAFLKTLNL